MEQSLDFYLREKDQVIANLVQRLERLEGEKKYRTAFPSSLMSSVEWTTGASELLTSQKAAEESKETRFSLLEQGGKNMQSKLFEVEALLAEKVREGDIFLVIHFDGLGLESLGGFSGASE